MQHDEPVLFHGQRFDVVRVDQPGNDDDTYVREIVRHPGAVVILPFVSERQVCLIRNLRVAVGETLIELPAGTREPDEPPERTAARELLEETGYTAGRLELMTSFFPSPGIMDEQMFLYSAHDLTAGPHAREAGEQIENLVVTLDEALHMVSNGKIRDGKTLVGLLLWSQQAMLG